ncbi:T9SS type A sorting domain-containing protein [Mariniflexile sp. HMF6888]|uniref:T9SS type A sorting domain-containing protein n=1 Tax=Mariniflexile sp. HMF6888 TaxID=3373086 RepID=UPI00378F25C5
MLNKFIIFFSLSCALSYGQLSIRNDAYIFITDEIVFVEDDINLNESDSKIYLRDEAQIIQGSGTTGNSGVGELSVYQEANVGAYEYNYWCSPIGSKTNNLVNNPFGISLLNDVIDLTNSTPATYIHSSSYNGTSTPLNIEPFWIWKYIAGSTYADWVHVQGNTTINPGEGFTMKGTQGSGDAQRFDFRGKPNNGTLAVDVSNNAFTLVGNPYPSAMDALAYIHDPDNAAVITGTLYYWEQDPNVNSHYLADYQAGYATYIIDASGTVETTLPATFNTYNGDGSINTGGVGTGSKLPKRYIPIGQGFMVEGTATGTVKAKNSHRVFVKETNVDSEFFKTTNSKTQKAASTSSGFSIVPSDYKRFRLNIDFNNTYTRQIAQTFHISATEGFDYGLETKINASDVLKSDAHWIIGVDSYTAGALTFDESLKIPLAIKVAKNMPVRIRIADVQNFENASSIYIHDTKNDTYVDLNNQDFNINLEAGNYSNRFEVTFTKNTLSNDFEEFKTLKVYHNNSTLTLNNPKAINIHVLELIDVTGKRVLHKKIQSTETTQNYSTKGLSDGVYIVNILLENDQAFTKKIIVSTKK